MTDPCGWGIQLATDEVSEKSCLDEPAVFLNSLIQHDTMSEKLKKMAYATSCK